MRLAAPLRPLLLLAAALMMAAVTAHAQTPSVLGYWRTPAGAVVRIAPCGQWLCVEIAELSRGNHRFTDMRNPDPRLRGRPLCGLRIGAGFLETDPQHASRGRLYDPKSGHTYSGQMAAEGNVLRLRGYLGVPIFGRTETWSRASKPPPCSPHISGNPKARP
ncbi:MAG TPA: DUF2147 domain-containing protein [Steroidobacteraceae bacterium]|jgi:uncharacterized protein (DUF2147 family)|nr:DUF2147 domain-containing protein [Steroidobacteraceae bacterium]